MTDLDKAREWAERWSEDDPLILADAKAAIKLIKALPDQWIDAEKLREVIEEYDSWESGALIDDLRALLTPSLPTLADMTQEEREACKWMQAKITDSDQTHVIAIPESTGAFLWSKDGHVVRRDNDRITPLPDLPKLEWPGSEVVETPALPEGMRLADHEEYGRVVVSPKVDTDGDYKVFFSGSEEIAGASWGYANKSELDFLDGEA